MKHQLAMTVFLSWLPFATPLLSMEYANDNQELVDNAKSVDEALWDDLQLKSKSLLCFYAMRVSKSVQQSDSIFSVEDMQICIASWIAEATIDADHLFKQIWERSLWTSLKKIDEQMAKHTQILLQKKVQSIFLSQSAIGFDQLKILELEKIKIDIVKQLKELH